jgi:hypothetical protein
MVGHDLVMRVTQWQATLVIDGPEGRAELSADPSSFEVLEGLGGVKPLSDRDREEIRKTIERKILGGKPILFHTTERPERDAAGAVSLRGELELAGTKREIAFKLQPAEGDGGRLTGSAVVKQSDWGIKPYSSFMGQLKVRDEVDVALIPAG